ncbi:MAG: OmpH family outer membrane protein [Candidatus Kapabacteria bacterium]|nr:OmpH family outer membrane protein [Candidatus Kapabacteria bacterium]
MKKSAFILFALALFFFLGHNLLAQKVGFISSDLIKGKYNEVKQGELRINSIVDEWKREIEGMNRQITSADSNIQKNRLIWSDGERAEKMKELDDIKRKRQDYTKSKFDNGGDYDKVVQMIMQPIEQKIYAATQEVASEESYDFIFDQSQVPIPYTNFKYDLTVKVLRKLGVNTDELEKDQKKKIEADPRNKKAVSKDAPRKTSRKSDDVEIAPVKKDNPAMPPGFIPIDPSNTPLKVDSTNMDPVKVPQPQIIK